MESSSVQSLLSLDHGQADLFVAESLGKELHTGAVRPQNPQDVALWCVREGGRVLLDRCEAECVAAILDGYLLKVEPALLHHGIVPVERCGF